MRYLGYILMRGGKKPQQKKVVQAILALEPPNNVKVLRHFLRMVPILPGHVGKAK